MVVTVMAGSPRLRRPGEDATHHHPRRRHPVAGPEAEDAAEAAVDYARGRTTVMRRSVETLMNMLQLFKNLLVLIVMTAIMATKLNDIRMALLYVALMLIVVTMMLTLTTLIAILLFLHGIRNLPLALMTLAKIILAGLAVDPIMMV